MRVGATYRPGPFRAAEVGGELFLLHPESGDSYRIGGAGPRFWALLTGGATLEETARTVAAETGEDPERVRADLGEFVARLKGIEALLPVES